MRFYVSKCIFFMICNHFEFLCGKNLICETNLSEKKIYFNFALLKKASEKGNKISKPKIAIKHYVKQLMFVFIYFSKQEKK